MKSSPFIGTDEAAIHETDNKCGTYCRRIAMNILQVLEDVAST